MSSEIASAAEAVTTAEAARRADDASEADPAWSRRRSHDEVVEALVRLYGHAFGGRDGGRYRVSRKVLRQIAGRRHLSERVLADIAEEMSERGFAFVDLETHFAVIDQRVFDSYRRVTALAAQSVLDGPGDA